MRKGCRNCYAIGGFWDEFSSGLEFKKYFVKCIRYPSWQKILEDVALLKYRNVKQEG
jgi:hypothetical protein